MPRTRWANGGAVINGWIATVKPSGGWPNAVAWRLVGVPLDADGRPDVRLYGRNVRTERAAKKAARNRALRLPPGGQFS